MTDGLLLLPLHLATMWGHVGTVDMLLQYDVLHTHAHTQGLGITELMGEIYTAHSIIDTVHEFMKLGSSPGTINTPDSENHTALHLSCIYNEFDVTKVLLSYHANVTSIDNVSVHGIQSMYIYSTSASVQYSYI